MDIPDLPPDIRFARLPLTEEAVRASFEVKRAALGPIIVQRWEWDEAFQQQIHRQHFREKPFFGIARDGRQIGTVSLMPVERTLRFGEFYLYPDQQGHGLGSRILRHCLALADAGALPVRLEYLKWNPVGSLYRRHGFVVIGETDIHWQMQRMPLPPSP